MGNLHRRDWLKQSSLLFAGLGLTSMPALAKATDTGSDPGRPVRLTSNENPYGPSPLAQKAMADAVGGSNRYPWDVTAS